MTPLATPERSTRHQFPAEILSPSVWWYDRFCLSYRDVEAILVNWPYRQNYVTQRSYK